jgi:hypothetical protein
VDEEAVEAAGETMSTFVGVILGLLLQLLYHAVLFVVVGFFSGATCALVAWILGLDPLAAGLRGGIAIGGFVAVISQMVAAVRFLADVSEKRAKARVERMMAEIDT